LRAINRAKKEPNLDFHPVELGILELSAHYVFYYLIKNKKGDSPIFGIQSKSKYISKLSDFARTGQKIRVGKKSLSALVREVEVRYKVREGFAEIIEKLEVNDEP
jgi:hypothetical protein